MKIVKFYTLFNFQDIVFSSTYLTRISEIRECPLPPRRNVLQNLF